MSEFSEDIKLIKNDYENIDIMAEYLYLIDPEPLNNLIFGAAIFDSANSQLHTENKTYRLKLANVLKARVIVDQAHFEMLCQLSALNDEIEKIKKENRL